jgi:hypothetical protein
MQVHQIFARKWLEPILMNTIELLKRLAKGIPWKSNKENCHTTCL